MVKKCQQCHTITNRTVAIVTLLKDRFITPAVTWKDAQGVAGN
jgi:hypothetical protein